MRLLRLWTWEALMLHNRCSSKRYPTATWETNARRFLRQPTQTAFTDWFSHRHLRAGKNIRKWLSVLTTTYTSTRSIRTSTRRRSRKVFLHKCIKLENKWSAKFNSNLVTSRTDPMINSKKSLPSRRMFLSTVIGYIAPFLWFAHLRQCRFHMKDAPRKKSL